MKKLLAVLLVTAMFLSVGLIAIPVSASDGFAHMYYDIDILEADGSYVKGWTLNGTSTASQIKMTKFGYKLDDRAPIWKVTSITDGTSFPDSTSWAAYHNASEGGIEAGFGGSFYRIQGVLSKAVIEEDYGITMEGAHKITYVAQFDDENNSIVNVFGACTLAGVGSLTDIVFSTDWTENASATVPVESGVTYDGTTFTHVVTNQAKDGSNNVKICVSEGTGNLVVVTTGNDPYVSITLPNIAVGAYTGMVIKYRASSAPVKKIYMKEKKETTNYTETSGACCTPAFVGDGEWHTAVYYISSDNLSKFVDKTLTGVRIPGANGKGNYIEIESITFDHWINLTSFDEVQDHKGIKITCNTTDRTNVQLGDITQVAKDSFRMRGWVASPVKITEFGYLTDGNYVFNQANAGKAATEAAVVGAGASIAGTNGESVRFYIQNIPRINSAASSAFGVARLENDKVVKITGVYYSATDDPWQAPPVSLTNSNVDAIELNGSPLNDPNTITGGNWLAQGHSIVLVKGEQNVLNIRGWTQVANGTITEYGYKLDSEAWVDSSSFVHERSASLAAAGVAGANGFNYFNIPTDGLASGEHTLKFRVKALDENNELFKKAFFTITFRVVDFKFSAVNVSLAPGAVTDINFKINKAELEGANNVSVKFLFNGEETDAVDSSEATDTVAVYKFSGIGPEQIADEVTATITATYGETQLTYTKTYSVKQYCMDALGDAPAANTLNTLLVDLLRYGAAAQTYANYNTNDLADKDLTAAQLAVGTDVNADLNLTQISKKITAITSGEKKVKWTTVHLKLEGNVAIVLKLNKLEGKTFANDLTVKYTIDDGAQVYEATMLDQTSARINMPVNMMKSVIHAAVYDGDTVVSSTVNYSIESYAAAKQNETTDSLGELVKAMMRFGNAAAAYQPAA